MNILSFLGNTIKPVTELIDKLSTSDEEKKQLYNELTKIENTFAEKVLNYESKMQQLKADIITSEAKGESWLQRNWRPVTMLTFLLLICGHYAGILAFEIADQMWTLLQIGIGGYIGSRGAEKIIPAIINKLKKE